MKLYEYQAKSFFSKYGIPVPESGLASTPQEAAGIAGRFPVSVVKAQVLAGGRGKAGGVVKVKSKEEAEAAARKILGISIKGMAVKKVLIEEAVPHTGELYLALTIDRDTGRYICILSSDGGVDIEITAKESPEKIHKVLIDPFIGLRDYQLRYLSSKAGTDVGNILRCLYKMFVDLDCSLTEINPLAVTSKGVCALDAKMIVDDSALFRQQEIAGLAETIEIEVDPLEAEAKKSGMSYVGLAGNIGCVVNGAGLSMATMDLIKKYGGEPANFLDVRGGAKREQVSRALKIISSKEGVDRIVINIFGGITRCDEIAEGIRDVLPELRIPLVVRLTGTNEKEGIRMLEGTGIIIASSTEDAARKGAGKG